MDTVMGADDKGAPATGLSTTMQQVWGYLLQTYTLAKGMVTSLTNRGVPKYVMVMLFLLAANWLGNTVYEAIPASLGGIPTAIGAMYLCPLVLRANREKLMNTLQEYLG